jgi:hypothetical protein
MGNFHGIFYEIPRAGDDKLAPDFARMRPVTTHRQPITDYCTWRGLLVLAGGASLPNVGKVLPSPDGKSSLWFGAVDDLWRFGKPTGVGGPWKDAEAKAGQPSDPYLMTNFDKKSLTVSQTSSDEVDFSVELDFLGTGVWRAYTRVSAKSSEPTKFNFPAGFAAHWVRLTPSKDCTATAQFRYE